MQGRYFNNKLSIFNKAKNLDVKTTLGTSNPKSLVTPSGPMMKSQSKIQPKEGNQEFPHNGRQPQQASLHNRSSMMMYNNKNIVGGISSSNSNNASSRFANLLTPKNSIQIVNNKQMVQKSLTN